MRRQKALQVIGMIGLVLCASGFLLAQGDPGKKCTGGTLAGQSTPDPDDCMCVDEVCPNVSGNPADNVCVNADCNGINQQCHIFSRSCTDTKLRICNIPENGCHVDTDCIDVEVVSASHFYFSCH
jgi:hypothetical protein